MARFDYSDLKNTWIVKTARISQHGKGAYGWCGIYRVEKRSGGISGCAAVARSMRDYESAKRLARILYTYYDARGDAESAARYNDLVTQWQHIMNEMGSPEQLTTDI